MKLIKQDFDFIWKQLRLLNNSPLTPLDSTGIRDVQGVGNNILHPYWGTADTLFPRLTYNSLLKSYDPVTGKFTVYTPEIGGYVGNVSYNAYGPAFSGLAYDANYRIDYATRGKTIFDAAPRIISNLISSQTGLSDLRVQDDPSATPGGRLSPITGNVNPLPYSSYMTLFGQFFDHGLDFVHKGADGTVFVPLLPGDSLYNQGSPVNYMIASRTNTVNVTIGVGSTDALVSSLGLGTEGTVNWSALTGTNALGSSYTGTLVINNHMIQLKGANATQLVTAINAATHETGVTASIVNNRLVLTPAKDESFNTVSPFIDLSQSYGSAPSHTVFLREYDAQGHVTGRLVSGGLDENGDQLPDGMATWADIKANALKIGITLHDYNVEDVPLVRLNADGSTYFDVNGQAWLVALNKTTGAIVYVQNSAKDALASNNLVLMTTGHAFLDDMAHGVLYGLNAAGDVINSDQAALLAAHFVAGDGRVNENIGLTAIHDVFHSEHNRLVDVIKAQFLKDGSGAYLLDAQGHFLDADGKAWSTEDVFQAAKFITEMEYQHLVFGEFARKLSPNIKAFAGYDVTIDPSISAEFAHAVYRFGHSMLTESIDMFGFDPLTGLANGDDNSMGLIEAFLNPGAYTSTTAGEIALGMSGQVGNAIDEWVTDALRNNLVGLPLDLATLNIVRGRDAGIPSLNEVRMSLFQQTGMTSLKPYASWDEVGMNLLHPESLINFIMAYARDDVLVKFGTGATGSTIAEKLAYWNGLQLSNAQAYADALRAAATQAFGDRAFMTGGNLDFWDIDLWIGGLAEKKVSGGMLGATFDFIFATQMIKLQDGDRFYYLERLLGTNLLAEIEGQLFSDIVMRNTGVEHLYPDIFSVPDGHVEMSAGTHANVSTLTALLTTTHTVTDAYGIERSVGTAGYVGGTFYGNPGNYLDARGVLNPNGAGNASEVIGGTAGNDTINGLGGNDAIYGDAGDDKLEGDYGNDFLHGGDGNDVLTDKDGDDLLWGDAGNDTINGGSGIDQVFGGEGDDAIYGGLGADIVDGGDGNDDVYGDNGANATVTITRDANGKITSVLVSGNMDPTGDADVISGGAGDDVLFGGGGSDLLNGGVGDDWLIGGGGADAMIGWDGNDRFLMDAGDIGLNHAMDGGLGFDIVDYSNSVGNDNPATAAREGISINLSNAGAAVIPVGNNVMDTYLSVEGVIGSAYNDTLVGGAAVQTDQAGNPIPLLDANGNPVQQIDPVTGLPVVDAFGNPVWVTLPINFLLDGRDGNDMLVGDAGNDTLIGGNGNDTLIGGLGNDTASYEYSTANVTVDLTKQGTVTALRTQNTGGGGTDALVGIENVTGGLGNDNLTGDANANILAGGAGSDVLTGGDGNDTLMGGAGNDTLNGGNGIDTASYADATSAVTVTLATTNSQTTGGSGSDRLSNIENLTGSNFNDLLTGSTGSNVMDGGSGNDSINAGDGNDTLIGGAGNDSLNGGAGTDVAVFSGRSSDYRISVNAGVLTVQDLRFGTPDGTDTLTSVETLRFADRSVATSQLTNPPSISIQATPVVQAEGTGGSNGSTNFVYTVTLSAAYALDVSVNWAVTAGTANAADFPGGLLPSGILTIAAGATTGTITVPVLADTRVEADESFSVVLTNPTGGSSLANAIATGTVVNDDAYVASLTASATSLAEGAGPFAFTVNLSEPVLQDVTLNYEITLTGTSPATADDFAGGASVLKGTVLIKAGDSAGTVSIALVNDSWLEPNETFTFSILTPPAGSNVVLGTASVTVTILNDDQNINGTANADTLTGNEFANLIYGLGGSDTLIGLGGNDTLYGGDGNDTLRGGSGSDELYGGAGADRFLFDTLSGVDNVMDFESGDLLVFSRAVFSGLGSSIGSTTLRITDSTAGGSLLATNNNQRFIYDAGTGDLYYDADGAKSASMAVLVGHITTDGSHAATLTAASFAVVA